MTVKMWFCWERQMTGNWQPVCYHDEQPKKEKVSDGDTPSRSPLYEVPADCLSDFDEPFFGRLKEKFPAPRSEQ